MRRREGHPGRRQAPLGQPGDDGEVHRARPEGPKGWADGADLVRLGVEANVRRQGEELLRRSAILRKAVAKDEILILRAVYDIHTGRVRPL